MRFITNRTACAACGRLLDVTDDTVAVSPHEGQGTPWGGFLHRGCFELLPDAARMTDRWSAKMRHLVRTSAADMPVLGEASRFALVAVPVEGTFALYLFDGWAELRFEDAAAWREFAGFVDGDAAGAALADGSEGEAESPSGRFELKWAAADVWLTWVETVVREIEFAAAVYESFAAANGHLRDFVNFAALAESGALVPTAADGAVDRCRGTVTRVRHTRTGYAAEYDAERPTTVRLGRNGLDELRQLVRRVGPS